MADKFQKSNTCSKQCPICKHPLRIKIDTDFLHGINPNEIKNRYSNGQGTFDYKTVVAHAGRTGLIKKLLNDSDLIAYQVMQRIDPDTPATFADWNAALTRRDKVQKLYGDKDSQAGLLSGANVDKLLVVVGNLSTEDRAKLIEAKQLIEGKDENGTE